MAYAAPPAPRSILRVDELGFVPLSKTGAELLFEVFSQRYERGSILVTSNLAYPVITHGSPTICSVHPFCLSKARLQVEAEISHAPMPSRDSDGIVSALLGDTLAWWKS